MIGSNIEFTGKERDAETGLDYFGARYFSGAQGRFTSPDPLMASAKISNPQTWNMYGYSLNNPLRYTDPNGESVTDPEDVNEEIRKRKLEKQRQQLTEEAKNLAKEVKDKKLTSKEAIDKFFAKAQDLTKGMKDAAGSALILATALALDARGSVGNIITRDALGEDTLHHFFINAFNTFEGGPFNIGIPVWMERFGANTLRGEDDARDINANNLGARFGDRIDNYKGKDPLRPSSMISQPPPKPTDKID
jgi:RHS repeat-associated protein